MEHAIERPATISPATLEKVLIGGDLSKLSESQRVEYYAQTCTSLGLNPLTKPFDYITLNGKLTLYAKRDAADQLRRIYGVSITKLEREQMGDVYAVTAYASLPDGRTDSSMGAVNTKGLAGEALANALMKAETKAKRRVTLSICGLGMLDETEVSTIPSAAQVVVSQETGEIIDAEPSEPTVPPLKYEEAAKVVNSKGVAYGEIDLETLRHMRRSLTRHIATCKPEERSELEYKLAATIAVIDHLTTGEPVQQPMI